MAKLPPKIGPVVTKGLMLTAEQFFAHQEARRGTRNALDEALSLALWALDSNLAPMVRARFDANLALVVKARDADPLGILPASPEVEEACRWLSEIGKTARAQAMLKKNWSSQGGKGRTAETDDGVANLKAFFKQKGWDINILATYHEHNTTKKKEAAKALGVTLRTIDNYVTAMFPGKKQKRRPRAPSSETPRKKVRNIVRKIR
jgi:hypothetical protein